MEHPTTKLMGVMPVLTQPDEGPYTQQHEAQENDDLEERAREDTPDDGEPPARGLGRHGNAEARYIKRLRKIKQLFAFRGDRQRRYAHIQRAVGDTLE